MKYGVVYHLILLHMFLMMLWNFKDIPFLKIIKLFFIEMQYKFCPDGNDKLLVTFNYKVISCSESRGRFNILNFQERQCQKQIKVLIDQ